MKLDSRGERIKGEIINHMNEVIRLMNEVEVEITCHEGIGLEMLQNRLTNLEYQFNRVRNKVANI